MENLNNRLKEIIGSHDMMIFMKGTPEQPMCRFSAHTVSMLNQLDKEYGSFNILEDMDVREGLKAYSNWPTYPQLYYKNELIGGCDIISEMFENGELQDMLK